MLLLFSPQPLRHLAFWMTNSYSFRITQGGDTVDDFLDTIGEAIEDILDTISEIMDGIYDKLDD